LYHLPNSTGMSAQSETINVMALEPAILPETAPDAGLREIQTTKSGFVVAGPRLANLVPTPPNKKPKSSWIWKHGEPVTDLKDGLNKWLCRLCYDDSAQSTIVCVQCEPTNQAIRHLVGLHRFDKHGNKAMCKRQRDDEQQQDGNVALMIMKRQKQAQEEVFDREGWKRTYIKWLVSSNQSLRQASSENLKMLLSFQNPIIKPLVPRSHTTAHHWLLDAFTAAKPTVIRSLQRARSTISISFDNWLADNELDLLGVVAHYLDKELELKTILLALKPSFGHHGKDLQETLLAVLREYKISDKIGYFVADNAKNNDAALRLLSQHIDLKPAEQRLRCSGHIINLVVKAILYGVDNDCVLDAALSDKDYDGDSELHDTASVSQFEATLRSKDETSRLVAWRKKGPVGRLHNLIVHVKSGSVRRRFFEAKQRETDTRLYRVIVNGGIRWNSACEMIERAIQVKDALQLYQEHFQGDDNDRLDAEDCLSAADWKELSELLQLLKPLKEASLKVQAVATDGENGALWQNLSVLDWLLSTLENLKETLPKSHFRACVNLGWKKLDKYYKLSDTTAAYRLAIFLHPCFKRRWFERHWTGKKSWLQGVDKVVNKAWQDAKRRWPNEVTIASPQQQAMTAFDAYNHDLDDEDDNDELARYMREERAPKGTKPLKWWRDNHHRYPVLRHLAFEVLAAPASSSADERIFSIAGDVVNEERSQTQEELAEAYQGLKSWYSEGLL
jgi:hypothetical protein